MKPFHSILRPFIVSLVLFMTGSYTWAVSLPQSRLILPGEVVKYDIKKLGLNAGEASFHFVGEVGLDGKKALLLIFQARGMNFLDEEKIFMDPQTLLPLVVERDLNIWGKKEKIREVYASDRGVVQITKTVKGKTVKQKIAKKGRLDNIYCFIFRYRRSANHSNNARLSLNLPTKDIVFHHEGLAEVTIDGKKIAADYLASDPSKYKVWFATAGSNIPLKIDGALGIVKAVMVLKSYQPGKGIAP